MRNHSAVNPSTSAGRGASERLVWLDTDIGSDIDDAVALAYLLRQPRCQLLGLSTVTGPVEERARLASALALAAGRPDLPIFAGHSAPLSGPGQPNCPQTEALAEIDHRRDFPADPDAALAALLQAARRQPHELTLLTIGPLTNIAHFFRQAPELPGLLGEMVIMGGYFWPPKPEGVEWNIICDPEAARQVAAAPVRRSWFGLDVTLPCYLPAAEVQRRLTGPLLGKVARFAASWFLKHDRVTFHDPLATAAIFEPTLCDYVSARVEVTADGVPSEPGTPDGRAGRTVPHPVAATAAASSGCAAKPADCGCGCAGAAPSPDLLARTVRPAAVIDHYFATVG